MISICTFALNRGACLLKPLSGTTVNFCFGHGYNSAFGPLTQASFSLIGARGIHWPLTPLLRCNNHRQLSTFHFWKLLNTAEFAQIGFYSLE